MPERRVSDAEIRRRKKLQGHISQTTGTLGLAALGGTLVASRSGRNALRKIPQLKSRIAKPPPKNPKRDKIKGAVTPLLATSAGLGGLGAFNFATYTGAESRKRNMTQPVKKSGPTSADGPLEMGYYGDEGRPVKLPEIKVPIEKAWSPSASNFDSEAKREKRSNAYQTGALAGAGVGGAYAGHHGVQALRAGRNVKPKDMAEVKTKTKTVKVKGKKHRVDQVKYGGSTKSVPVKAFKPAAVHGGKAAAGLATVGLAAGAHAALKRKHAGSWQPYSKGLTMDEIEKALFKPGGAFKAFKGTRKPPKPVDHAWENETMKVFDAPKPSRFAASQQKVTNKQPANRAPKKTTAQLNVPAGHKPANYNRLRSYNEVNG